MPRVAIVGCGFVGRGWAISFARAGHDVALFDEDPAAPRKALDFIADVLPDLEAKGLLDGGTPAGLLSRIRTEADLAAALAGAIHVQENAPERLEVKQAVFARLDALAPPDAVLASSSSAIPPRSSPNRCPAGLAASSSTPSTRHTSSPPPRSSPRRGRRRR